MSQDQITVVRGGVRLLIDGRDFVVDGWSQAFEAISHARADAVRVPVGVDSGASRASYFFDPRSRQMYESDGSVAPEVFVAEVPWFVHAPMLQPDPLPAADASAALAAAQAAIDSLGRPLEVALNDPASGDELSRDRMMPTGFDGGQDTVAMAVPGSRGAPVDEFDELDDAWSEGPDLATFGPDQMVEDDQQYYDPMAQPAPTFDEGEDFDAGPLRVSGVGTTDPDEDRKRKMPTALIAGAVALVLMLAAAIIVPSFILSDEEEPVAEATVPPLDRPPLAPWTSEFSWTMGVDPSGRVGASPDGRFIGLIAPSEAMHVVSGASGETLASVAIPGGAEVGPRGTTVGGEQALVARGGDTLYVWAEGMTEPGQFDLVEAAGAGASVTFAGREPVVLSKDAVKAFRVTAEGLEEVEGVEEGARPYAVTEDGETVVGKASPARLGLIGGKDVKLADPGGKNQKWEADRWMYVSDAYALILWAPAESSKGDGVLAIHSVESGKILASETIEEIGQMASAGVVTNEQGGTFAVPGYTFVVDPEGQEVSVVESEGFIPSSIVGDVVFGKDGSGRAVVRVTDEDHGIEQIDASVLVPWATTADGSGIAVSGGVAYKLAVQGASEVPTPAAPGDLTSSPA